MGSNAYISDIAKKSTKNKDKRTRQGMYRFDELMPGHMKSY